MSLKYICFSVVIIDTMETTIQKTNRKDEISCVQLSKDTKAKLDNLGTKKDTYESIILKMLDSQCVTKGENSEEDSDE